MSSLPKTSPVSTRTNKPSTTDAFAGCLLGLAVGDALGAPVEMMLPETFTPIANMRGGGYFELAPGEWTDDTSLALCSATSLIEMGTFDPHDHLIRFLRWYREGYMSTRNQALGIGLVTAGALMRFESTNEDFCGPTGDKTAHNGSLMCLAPTVLAYAHSYRDALYYAQEFSRLTHAAAVSIDSCRLLAHCIFFSIHGVAKKNLLSEFQAKTAPIELLLNHFHEKPKITKDNFSDASTTLHAALWAFFSSDDFADGLLKVVNLGWDADTMGAVYGQIAGAYYGLGHIPPAWREVVSNNNMILEKALALETLSRKTKTPRHQHGVFD